MSKEIFVENEGGRSFYVIEGSDVSEDVLEEDYSCV